MNDIDLDTVILANESYEQFLESYVLSHTMIGSGAFSKVFEHPLDANKVIKIGLCKLLGTMQYIKAEKEGYLAFLKECLKNQDNPFFPKIYDGRVYKYDTEQYYYIVVLEKLEAYGYDDDDANPIKEEYMKKIGITTYSDIIGLSFGTKDNAKICNKLKNACHILGRLFNEFCEDLHRGNVMWRKIQNNYELVIIDPVFTNGDYLKLKRKVTRLILGFPKFIPNKFTKMLITIIIVLVIIIS